MVFNAAKKGLFVTGANAITLNKAKIGIMGQILNKDYKQFHPNLKN